MHGGIGMTDQFDIGFFMKRARVCQELFGDRNFHADQLARIKSYSFSSFRGARSASFDVQLHIRKISFCRLACCPIDSGPAPRGHIPE